MTWMERARREGLKNIKGRVITRSICEVMAIPIFRPIQLVPGVSPRPAGPPNTICLRPIFVGKSSHQKIGIEYVFSETIFDDVDG